MANMLKSNLPIQVFKFILGRVCIQATIVLGYKIPVEMGDGERVGAKMLCYTSVSDAPFRRQYGGQLKLPQSSMLVSPMRQSIVITVRQVEPGRFALEEQKDSYTYELLGVLW